MFVLQNRDNSSYVQMLERAENGSAVDTYRHVVKLSDATVFTWAKLAQWINRRVENHWTVPVNWYIVEVEAIPQPQFKIIKVIG